MQHASRGVFYYGTSVEKNYVLALSTSRITVIKVFLLNNSFFFSQKIATVLNDADGENGRIGGSGKKVGRVKKKKKNKQIIFPRFEWVKIYEEFLKEPEFLFYYGSLEFTRYRAFA